MKHRSELLLCSVFSFSFALVTGILWFIDPQSLDEQFAWMAYAIILACLLSTLLLGKYWLDRKKFATVFWLHPPALLTVWILVSMGIPGLAGFFFPELLRSLEEQTTVSYIYAVWGMALVFVGLLSLCVGYILGLRFLRPLKSISMLANANIMQVPAISFYALIVLARVFRIVVTGIAFGADRSSLGAFSIFDQWLGYLESANLLIISILISKVYRKEWSSRLMIAVFAIELAFDITSGFMKPILWLGITVYLTIVSEGVVIKRNILYAIIIIVFIPLGIFVVPISEGLRQDYGGFNAKSLPGVINATVDAYGSTWGQGFDVGMTIFSDKIFGRQAQVAQMPGIIMRLTPSVIPYQGFQQFLLIPAYIIPRALWIDKPILSQGVWFSITYLNMPSYTDSSSAITVFGETYMFGGWGGTILGLFLLGVMLAFLFQNTVLAKLLPVYVALIPSFLDMENQFSTMAVSLFQATLVFLIIYWILIKVSQSSMNSSARLVPSIRRS
jgi:hypothetical protein